MINLFKLAQDNSSSLQSRFEDFKGKRPPKELATIERCAELVLTTSRVSMNMRPSVLSELIANGPYQNTYERAQELSELSGRSAEAILRETLREYYDRRIAFDGAFEDGRSFRYGALNIGGPGTTSYAQFCCVLSSSSPVDPGDIAYLKSDSLKNYVGRDNAVRKDALARDVATHGSRHHIAVLKHVDQIVAAPEEEWAELICSNEDCIEAIFVRKVTKDEFDEVRITVEDYDELWESAFADLGSPLAKARYAEAQDFVVILRAERDGIIKLRRV